jgi:hypothetical protein
MATPKKKVEEVLDTDQQAAAEASTKAANEKRKAPKDKKSGVGVLRKKGSSQTREFFPSKIPYPAGIHGEDFELYGPSGFASFVPKDVDISVYSNDQEFMIDEDKVKVLYFQNAGRNLPKKRLYTVKAIHRDGRLVQLPFELQIQNNAGGDPEDAIGLHRYERKGIHVLIDWDTLIPVYCAAWGCFAAAAQNGENVAFCSLRHAQHTLPNQHKGGNASAMDMFSKGSTTSRTWGG